MSEPGLSEAMREPAPGPGAVLARERKAQGLSISDVSREIKLTARQVEALETDDYAALPGATFVRGFVKNYARLLGLDPVPLLQGLDREPPAPLRPAGGAAAAPLAASARPRRGLVWASLAVAVALLLWAGYDTYERRVASLKPQPASESAPPAAAPVAAPAPAPPPVAAVPEPPPPAPEPAPEPKAFELKFAAKKDAWVQVKDGTGELLLSRNVSAGSERVITGKPPFSLVVGNANNVAVTMNGKTVELTPHSKGNVARLTLE